MSSSIYDPFVVTNLPRLPPKSDISKLCLISQIDDASSSNFDISVSGSYISTFVTRPSPKMTWSYSLSPESNVNALDSFDFNTLNSNNTNDSLDDKKIFAISFNERKKNKMKFISYGESLNSENNFDDENQSSSMSVVNEEEKNTNNELENMKEVKDKLTNTSDKIIGLKFSSDSKFVYALSEKFEISVWKFSTDPSIDNEPILKFNTAYKKSVESAIFYKFIKPEQLKVTSRTDKLDYLLLTVETVPGDSESFLIRIFSLISDEVLEISSSKIERNPSIEDIKFCYDISGKLIILENKSTDLSIKSYSLPLVKFSKQLNISGVFQKEPESAPTSIMCASTNRLLVTKGSTVALIDIQHGCLLSSLDLYSRSKDLENENVKPPRNATLLSVPAVNGNTLKSKKTFALLILKNTKENTSQIQHISIDVGLGKLRDALGKSLPKMKLDNEKPEFTSFPLYFNSQESEKSTNEIANLNRSLKENNSELSKVYEELKKLKESNKLELLEKNIISYLKNREFGHLYEDNEFKVYEYEKDRFVDPKFFKLLTLLLFEYDSKHDRISLNENVEQIPENGLTYVLTHPLFPRQYSKGLLKVLENVPRLQRQAIVTCVNIPCSDFILELGSVENDEIFKDIILRLNEEFSNEQITQETIKIINEKSNNNFDLDKIISKIIKLDFGYELLNSFIDSNGLVLSLHYSKDETELDKLINQTQSKVDTLLDDTQLLTLVNQTLSNSEEKKTSKKTSKKSKKKDPKNIGDTSSQAIEIGITKIDMMLNVSDKEAQQYNKSLNKKKSSYTIDRLVL